LIDLMILKMAWTRVGASPSDGSSSSSRRGRIISARAIASICCSPPLSSAATWLTRWRIQGKYS